MHHLRQTLAVQFDMDDRTHVRIGTNKMKFLIDPSRQGVEVMPLFNDTREDRAIA